MFHFLLSMIAEVKQSQAVRGRQFELVLNLARWTQVHGV